MVLFISGSEIFIILAVILVLFGAKQLPDIAKGFGKGMKEFKKATDDIKREISDADVVKDFTETKSNIEDTFNNFNITEDIVEEDEDKEKSKKSSENSSEEDTANDGYDYYANSESHKNTTGENNEETSGDDKSEETNENKTRENRTYGEGGGLQG